MSQFDQTSQYQDDQYGQMFQDINSEQQLQQGRYLGQYRNFNAFDQNAQEVLAQEDFSDSVRASDLYRNPNAQGQKTPIKGKRAKRRSKNDVDGRVHICGCGKSYLSYPALYTHIKTKHHGIEPGGTKVSKRSGRGRGRPRKHQIFKLEPMNLDPVTQDENQEEKTIQTSFKDITDDQFFAQLGGARKDQDPKVDIIQDWPIVVKHENDEGKDRDKKDENNQSQSSQSSQNDNQEQQDDLLTEIKHHCDRITNKKPDLDWLNIDQLLARYIYEVSEHLSKFFFKIFVIILKHFRNYLNDYGWMKFQTTKKKYYVKIHKQSFDQSSQGSTSYKIINHFQKELFTKLMDGDVVTQFVGAFVQKYLPQNFSYIDGPMAGILLLNFSRWLLKNSFCHQKFNAEEFNAINKIELRQ